MSWGSDGRTRRALRSNKEEKEYDYRDCSAERDPCDLSVSHTGRRAEAKEREQPQDVSTTKG